MKRLLTILFLFTCLIGFGQGNFFWSHTGVTCTGVQWINATSIQQVSSGTTLSVYCDVFSANSISIIHFAMYSNQSLSSIPSGWTSAGSSTTSTYRTYVLTRFNATAGAGFYVTLNVPSSAIMGAVNYTFSNVSVTTINAYSGNLTSGLSFTSDALGGLRCNMAIIPIVLFSASTINETLGSGWSLPANQAFTNFSFALATYSYAINGTAPTNYFTWSPSGYYGWQKFLIR